MENARTGGAGEKKKKKSCVALAFDPSRVLATSAPLGKNISTLERNVEH